MCRCSIRIVFPFGEGVGGVASKGNILSSSALAPTLWLRPHSAPLMEIHVLCFPYIYTIHSDKLKSTSFQKATITNKIKSINYKKYRVRSMNLRVLYRNGSLYKITRPQYSSNCLWQYTFETSEPLKWFGWRLVLSAGRIS